MQKPQLYGSGFITRTDHKKLWWLLNLKKSERCPTRWRLRAVTLKFDTVHRPEIYRKTSEKMFGLPQKAAAIDGGNMDVDNDIRAYSIVE